MTSDIANDRHFLRHTAVAAVLFCAVALGGCQSPMYSGTPEDMSYAVAPSYDPSYVGRSDKTEGQPAEQAWSAEQKYEYRGGRDPVTGRANSQM
jgi:hypothetical protein